MDWIDPVLIDPDNPVCSADAPLYIHTHAYTSAHMHAYMCISYGTYTRDIAGL